jgi:hypothetical protein
LSNGSEIFIKTLKIQCRLTCMKISKNPQISVRTLIYKNQNLTLTSWNWVKLMMDMCSSCWEDHFDIWVVGCRRRKRRNRRWDRERRRRRESRRLRRERKKKRKMIGSTGPVPIYNESNWIDSSGKRLKWPLEFNGITKNTNVSLSVSIKVNGFMVISQ